MNKLKELREQNDESQEDLGKLVGVKKSTISKYENDSLEMSNETLKTFADHFGVTIDYLICRKNINENKYKHLNNTLIGRLSNKIEKMSDDELELLDNLVDKIMKDER